MGRAKPKEAGSSRRLSREDWINGAIRLLSEGGLEGLSVNCLADRLCVTKGSFYWHFRDREALLDAVVDTWKRRTTSEIGWPAPASRPHCDFAAAGSSRRSIGNDAARLGARGCQDRCNRPRC